MEIFTTPFTPTLDGQPHTLKFADLTGEFFTKTEFFINLIYCFFVVQCMEEKTALVHHKVTWDWLIRQ